MRKIIHKGLLKTLTWFILGMLFGFFLAFSNLAVTCVKKL
jgi:hypothetical protein